MSVCITDAYCDISIVGDYGLHRRIQGGAKGFEDPPNFFQIRFLIDGS